MSPLDWLRKTFSPLEPEEPREPPSLATKNAFAIGIVLIVFVLMWRLGLWDLLFGG